MAAVDPARVNKDPVKCGGCGGAPVELFAPLTGDPGALRFLLARCVGCGAWSEIGLQPAAIEFRWCAGGQKGTLCAGWPEGS